MRLLLGLAATAGVWPQPAGGELVALRLAGLLSKVADDLSQFSNRRRTHAHADRDLTRSPIHEPHVDHGLTAGGLRHGPGSISLEAVTF